MAMSVVRRLVSRIPVSRIPVSRVRRNRCPECGRPVRQLHCDVCGYDVIAQARDKALRSR